MHRSNGEAAAKNTGEVLKNLHLSHSPENSQKKMRGKKLRLWVVFRFWISENRMVHTLWGKVL